MKLRILKNTIAKISDKQSSQLTPDQKFNLAAGTYDCESLKLVDKHYQLKFSDKVAADLKLAKPDSVYYVWFEDATPVDGKKRKLKSGVSISEDLPSYTKLAVPFSSQLDNERNPNGSCNVTSLSMGLQYFGNRNYSGYKGYKQLEDYIYDRMISSGLSRHVPADLLVMYNQLAKELKAHTHDVFTPAATWNELFMHLAKGFPAITHLYTTNFGHIFPIIGYDLSDETIIVHDPFGDFSDGVYHPREAIDSGKGAKYKIKDMIPLGAKDGDFWLHLLRQ